jgi:hypothetical protein
MDRVAGEVKQFYKFIIQQVNKSYSPHVENEGLAPGA